MTNFNTGFRKILGIIATPAFFWCIVGLLVLEALWIGFSGLYPMAFDEEFHLGIIQLYAHHLSPFWQAPPDGASALGAVSRDPSFLYHYLMSFPYRLISSFTDNQYITVMLLRIINVGLFASGLVLSKKLLHAIGASRALANYCLLILVLIPVVPLLAAQINYDNLFFPLTVICLLLTIKLDKILVAKKRVDAQTVIALGLFCGITSLVKYAFLPIFVAIFVFVVTRLLQYRHSLKLSDLASSWTKLGLITKSTLVIGLVLIGGLGVERYGLNLLKYHTPVADCSDVLSVDECMDYGPWARDYNLSLSKPSKTDGIGVYAHEWFHGMWLRSFFALAGPSVGYQTRSPYPVPGITAIVLAIIGFLSVVFALPRLLKKYHPSLVWLILSVSLTYVAILWLDGLMAFHKTGKAVAINGRYLLPIAVPMMGLAGLAVNELVRRHAKTKITIAVVTIACLIYGGGALTYILRSNDDWYWTSSRLTGANHFIQRDIGKYILGNNRPNEFLN